MEKSLTYLLTPAQRDRFMDKSTKAKAMLAIQNLHKYNVILGMAERMPESLAILRHVFLKSGVENPLKDKAEAVFQKYGIIASLAKNGMGNHTAPSVSAVGVHENESSGNNVSTSAVVAELAKDKEHVPLMEEYIKYERMITDFAWIMHNLQYDCVMWEQSTADRTNE